MNDQNGTTEQLRARIAELDAKIKLQARLAQLEERVRNGPSPGSPAAMQVKTPKQAMFGGAPSRPGEAPPGFREAFAAMGNYEKL